MSGWVVEAREEGKGEPDWFCVVYLHWFYCWLCGHTHHSYMQHHLDDDGKIHLRSPHVHWVEGRRERDE